jgi:hypothetical protein
MSYGTRFADNWRSATTCPIWVAKYESGTFEDDVRAADLLSQRVACPRCKAPMAEVVNIAPVLHEARLIAYECRACHYVTSVLWQPNEPRSSAREGF